MTPTADQITRGAASDYDVEARFYTADLPHTDSEMLNITADSAYSPSVDWTEVTDIVTGVGFFDAKPDGSAEVDWTATISGTTYNASTIAPDLAFLAMRRFYTLSTGWSAWVVWFNGWFSAMPGVNVDYRDGGEWAMQVESVSQFTKTDDAPALRFGKTNIALSKSVSVSSTLGSPLLEANNGEYLGYSHDISGSDAVDGNMDTLWISSNAPSTTDETPTWPGSPPDYAINEVFNWPVGFDSTYGWIEVYCRWNEGDDDADDGTGVQSWYLYSESSGKTLDFRQSNVAEVVKTDEYFILCYDERKFRDLFDPGDAVVIEWRHLVCTDWSAGTGWSYDPTGDVLVADTGAGIYTCREVVAVGDIDPSSYAGWSGDPVSAPASGNSIRRNPAGTCYSSDYSNKDDFIEERYPSPGRHKSSEPDGWEWISVDLGTLSFELDSELTPSDTTLYIAGSADGLTKSGQILMDGDILSYTDRSSTTLTVPSGVRSETYPAATVFQQYEDGVATDNWKTNVVGWKRPEIMDDGTPRVPQNFVVYTSNEASPVYPGTENWGLDWARTAPWVEAYASTVWESTITPGRYRHIMLVIREMTDGGRAKVNELRVYPAYWTVTGGGNPILDSGTVDKVFDYLLINQFGLDSSQVTTDYNGYIGPFDTSQARYHSVLTQLARKCGLLVRYNRDATIEIMRDPSFPLHGAMATRLTFDASNLQMMKFTKKWGRIRQVRITAYSPTDERSFVASYPPQPLGHGVVETVEEPFFIGTQVEAQRVAEHIFKFNSKRQELTVVPVGPVDEWLRPMDRIRVDWSIEDSGAEVDDLFLVKGISVNLDMKNGAAQAYSETVHLVEYIP